MHHLTILLAFAGGASAFPKMSMESIASNAPEYDTVLVGRHEVPVVPRDVPKGPAISSSESNCGAEGPCTVFNAKEQLVSISGEHAYAAPGGSDIRGPCPGLNAAANHGYLPRSGISHIADTTQGLFQAYAMSPEVGAILATYAIVFEGDLTTLAWSIGGPPQGTAVLGGLLGRQTGLSYSHNNYEGDSSATRDDAYINNGDAFSMQVDRFTVGYSYTQNGGYTMDSFRQLFKHWQEYSVSNNPWYSTPIFSTVVVSPAAYNFVINFMSNRSAENPSGILTPENYKTFFAITGDYPNFTWKKGQEQIPKDFYRRTGTHPYTAQAVIEDVLLGYAAYPETLKIGGNTGKVNSFAGLDISDLTGGAYNLDQMLKDPSTFMCFLDVFNLQFIPYFLKPEVSALNAATALLNKSGKWSTRSDCPAVKTWNMALWNKYPGMSYRPTPA